jgi:Flp pilus assembly protein TadG
MAGPGVRALVAIALRPRKPRETHAMNVDRQRRRRRGTVLPIVALSLVALLGFTALAIDVGMLAIARTETQNAADAAALAAARSLNGSQSDNNNYAAAAPAALASAGSNTIMGGAVSGSQVQTVIGKYYYDSSQGKFVGYPIDDGSVNDPNSNWSLAKTTVTSSGEAGFATTLGLGHYNLSASATAVHRPRDVAIVIDFSGSMRFSSLLGLPYSGSRRQSNNPETVFPKFGHYSSSSADLSVSESSTTLGGYTYMAANTTESDTLNGNRPAIVSDFHNGPGQNAPLAFSSAGDGDSKGYVGGDQWLFKSGSTTNYATTVKDVFGSSSKNSSFEANGYDYVYQNKSGYDVSQFQGYTQGPRYWGKTFFIWPPDPRGATNTSTASQHDNGAKDWRQRFFLKSDGVTPVNDNTLLFNSSGRWLSPRVGSTTYYKVNYRAILYWLKNTGPNPFPSQLRAGRILYYSQIPDPTDTGLNTRMWSQYPVTNQDERFWKEYIDYVLGICQNGSSSWMTINTSSQPNIVGYSGYGDDFSWGSVSVSSKPTGSSPAYMSYTDNPYRPKAHMWFGAMTLADCLGSYNMLNNFSDGRFAWMPGTAHEAPSYACKLGIQAALSDIQNNHPNDQVTLIFYSSPRESANDTSSRFNNVRVPLSRNYSMMSDALFFPPSTLTSYDSSNPPRIFDSNNSEVPRPGGGTCFSMGLMLAYNQFSTNTALQTYNPSPALQGDAGGMGRRGAYKMVILETDGIPNVMASASFRKATGTGGANASYYAIRYNSSKPSSSEFPSVSSTSDNSSSVTSQIYGLASQLCALETSSSPGFSTSRKPVKIHCIGFGPVFDPSSSSRTSALTTLQQIERVGNTQSSDTPDAWLPDYKIVTGSDDQVIQNLRTAISNIMQDGVQVSLID